MLKSHPPPLSTTSGPVRSTPLGVFPSFESKLRGNQNPMCPPKACRSTQPSAMKWVLEILVVIGVLSMTLSTLAQESKDVPRVYTAEQAAAGERAVQNNAFGRCSDCHSNGLRGRNGDPDELPPLSSLPEDTQTMVGNYGGKVPQLAGPKFMFRTSFGNAPRASRIPISRVRCETAYAITP